MTPVISTRETCKIRDIVDKTQKLFAEDNEVDQMKRLKADKSPGINELYPKFLHDVRKVIRTGDISIDHQ